MSHAPSFLASDSTSPPVRGEAPGCDVRGPHGALLKVGSMGKGKDERGLKCLEGFLYLQIPSRNPEPNGPTSRSTKSSDSYQQSSSKKAVFSDSPLATSAQHPLDVSLKLRKPMKAKPPTLPANPFDGEILEKKCLRTRKPIPSEAS